MLIQLSKIIFLRFISATNSATATLGLEKSDTTIACSQSWTRKNFFINSTLLFSVTTMGCTDPACRVSRDFAVSLLASADVKPIVGICRLIINFDRRYSFEETTL